MGAVLHGMLYVFGLSHWESWLRVVLPLIIAFTVVAWIITCVFCCRLVLASYRPFLVGGCLCLVLCVFIPVCIVLGIRPLLVSREEHEGGG